MRTWSKVVLAGLVVAMVHAPVESAASPPLPGALAPRVERIPITGVDPAALADAPQPAPALAPELAAGAAADTPSLLDERPEVLTGPRSAQPFDLIALVWAAPGPTDVVVQVRVREDQAWTPWEQLELAEAAPDGASPDAAGAAGRASTEALLTRRATAFQVRVDSPDGVVPTALESVLVDAGSAPGDAALADASLSTAAAPRNPTAIRPYIFTRGQWGADESLRTCTPSLGSTVQMAHLHHTVSDNDYAPEDVPAMIRAIYAFHVQGRGWCDVGYNFLVDRFGRIWEGRYGGADRGVVGAHAGGFNGVSTGISMIGTYSTTPPSAATLDAVSQVIAWKLSIADRDPNGLATVTAGEGSTRFAAGTVVRLNVISGHRDTSTTECPGNAAYPLLPQVRSLVTQRMALAQHTPAGSIDLVAAGPERLQVAGWAIDADTTQPVQVVFQVNGQGYLVLADRPRPDLERTYPGYGPAHGFDVTVPATPGVKDVCVWATNVGPGASALLGCRRVTVSSSSPFGGLDGVQVVSGGVSVTGWVVDPDTAAPVYAWIDIDGNGAPVLANTSRPDVAAALPAYGDRHGYTTTRPATPGTHRVCAYGVNTGPGADTLLGCTTVTVGAPFGSLDAVRAVPGGVEVSGWTIDPDTTSPIYAWIDVNGTGRPALADLPRPDVAAAHPGYGDRHGYRTTIPSPPGPATVCAYGVNTGPGPSPQLGCRRLTIG